MHMDAVLPQVVAMLFVLLLIGLFVKLLRQPHVIAYLFAGILIGPFGLELFTDQENIGRLGSIGVLFLLFFVGMETDAKALASKWKLALVGTSLQVLLSVASIWAIGWWFDWPMSRIVLIGFVISLSSTAVIIKLMQDANMLESRVGQGVLSILLAQDLAIIPMLITIGMFEGGNVDTHQLLKQGVGAFISIALFVYLTRVEHFKLPLSRWLKQDHELQLFASLVVFLGISLLTAWFELSTALGAFLAGMMIGAARETQWVHQQLESFKVLFMALFFVSIGMLLDIKFLLAHLPQVLALLVAAIMTNTFINALILKLYKYNWRDSLYSGVMLSQIGEFSFVLTAVGLQVGIINLHGYQLALCVISLSLLVSPIWISTMKHMLKWQMSSEGINLPNKDQ